MTDVDRFNADQLAYWNGPGGDRWVARQEQTDLTLAPVAKALLALAAPRAGETVLDVGCGCGSTTLAMARAVGPSGRVNALDISEPMLAVARARAKTAGVANVDWRLGDAATAALDPFDLLASQFGVMFFGDPVAAFANMRRAARPGARLAFACWRTLAENLWVEVPLQAVYRHVPPLPKPEPGAPGMLALADPARVTRVLTDAGWAPPRLDKLDMMMDIAAGRGLDEAVDQAVMVGVVNSALRGQPPDAVAAATAALRRALEPHVQGRSVRLPGAVWLVSSTPA